MATDGVSASHERCAWEPSVLWRRTCQGSRHHSILERSVAVAARHGVLHVTDWTPVASRSVISLPSPIGGTLRAAGWQLWAMRAARHTSDSATFREHKMQNLNGTTLGQYRVYECIGAGGMASVYRAVQTSLGREVALKVITAAVIDEEEFRERFENEARAVAQLDHPNILAIYDFGRSGGTTYIAMPLIRGGTLKDRTDRGRLEVAQSRRILSELCDALQHAHQVGLVHRDVKPSNVLLHPDGRTLLSDFGLARRDGGPTALSAAGLPIGSPGYMAPEQALGRPIDARADIYSLGVLLFELLTGTLPFRGETALAVMVAAINDPVPSASALNPLLPAEVDRFFARVLGKEPAARPPTSAAMLQDFTSSLRGSDPSFAASGPRAPRSRSSNLLSYSTIKASLGAAPPPTGSAVATLELMGIPKLRGSQPYSLNAHFANVVHVARSVAGVQWPRLLQVAGLPDYLTADPPDDDIRTTPIEQLSQLNEAFDVVFGSDAPDRLRAWGRQFTDRSILMRKSSTTEQRTLRLIPGQQRKIGVLLRSFTHAMDEVRGEHLHTWKQIDPARFWLVHYSNLFALGRSKSEKSCHVWTASMESMLRWAGLANDWLVEEIECGCVTGTFDCVFVIRSVKT